MTDPAPNQPDGAATQHTTVIRGDQPVLHVTFAQPDDGRWFRLLNSLIDSGAWGRLSDSACRTLVVLARHASADGTSLPSLATLKEQAGLSKSAVYEALKELAAGDRPLIRKIPTGRAWELFPGRPFARRGLPGRGTPTPTTPASGRPFLSPQSATVDPPADGRGCQSAGAGAESAQPDRKSATADLLLRPDLDLVVDRSVFDESGDVGVGDDVGGVDEEAARRLQQIGVKRVAISDLVRRNGAEAVLTALANTEYKVGVRQIKTTPRQYFFNSLSNRYPLFAEVERQQAALDAAKALCAKVSPHMTKADLQLITRGLKNWRGVCRVAGFKDRARIEAIGAEEAPRLAAWLVEQASIAAGAHS